MSQFEAYFESEVARPVVSAGDNAYAVAVSRIGDDDGKAWRSWLAGADAMVKATICRAYEAQSIAATASAKAKMTAARETYAQAIAAGSSKTKALKAAQSVCPNFTMRDRFGTAI